MNASRWPETQVILPISPYIVPPSFDCSGALVQPDASVANIAAPDSFVKSRGPMLNRSPLGQLIRSGELRRDVHRHARELVDDLLHFRPDHDHLVQQLLD